MDHSVWYGCNEERSEAMDVDNGERVVKEQGQNERASWMANFWTGWTWYILVMSLG